MFKNVGAVSVLDVDVVQMEVLEARSQSKDLA